jgi:diamine N-acetyltransferase
MVEIKLRAPEPEDLDFLYTLENDQSLWAFSNTQFPYSKTVLKAYLENANQNPFQAGQCRFIIIDNDQVLGCIDLYEIDPINLKAGVGIAMLEKYRNKGIASHALKLLMDYSKSILNLNQLYAFIHKTNLVSLKLFENSGFKASGELKNWSNYKGKSTDVIVYQFFFE